MKLCDYGCGQEAKYKLQNGKWCCSKSYKKCKEIIRKNKEGQQKVKTYKECPYCHQMISYGIGNQYQLHINSCTYDKNKTIDIMYQWSNLISISIFIVSICLFSILFI